VKLPRVSLVSIEFVVLLVAVNLGILRGVYDDVSVRGLALGWTVHALFLLPMINVLLIAMYRLWLWHKRTARAVGFLIAGSAATAVVFGSCLAAPEAIYGAIGMIGRPIAVATLNTMTRYLGNAAMQTGPGLWVFGIIFELLFPMAFCCIAPLLAAFSGGWIAERLSSRARLVPALQD